MEISVTLEPRLYIIMRRDIPDMNPGKAMAQAAHAQADFESYLEFWSDDNELQAQYDAWKKELKFGVTTVLCATWDEMREISSNTTHAGYTVDPTYPWRNFYGEMFTSMQTTCMWAFVYDADEFELMKQFKLHE